MFKMLNTQWKMGLMMAVCALPILGLVAVRVFDLAVSNVALVALAIACPVSHLLMMGLGLHGHHTAEVSETNNDIVVPTKHGAELEHA